MHKNVAIKTEANVRTNKHRNAEDEEKQNALKNLPVKFYLLDIDVTAAAQYTMCLCVRV